MSEVPIRDAATVIIVRSQADRPEVLMGQRGKSSAFMPNKFVFPGGAVDEDDAQVALAGLPNEVCMRRLAVDAKDVRAQSFLSAGIREVWEETGLRFAEKGAAGSLWDGFSDGGYTPSADGLRYVFRAITPPGRPRRFDARFFLADASSILDDPDDFSKASDELSHLHWVPLTDARRLDLPFITEVVLAEVDALLARAGSPESVPFFDNSGEKSKFRRIT